MNHDHARALTFEARVQLIAALDSAANARDFLAAADAIVSDSRNHLELPFDTGDPPRLDSGTTTARVDGGNAPLIVFDDADLQQAVAGTMASKFRNAGQTCVCANRILVQAGIFDKFVASLKEAAGKLVVAPGREATSTIGPLINTDAIEKVKSLLSDAVSHGAKVEMGGKPDDHGALFFSPTIVTGITDKMAIATEEIFGPVASIFRFETEADAIRIANDTPFGLAAYLFSQNLSRAWRVAEALEAGMVGVNEGVFSNEVVPFGGIKQSGLGREGAQEGLDEYLETKFICLGGISA